MLLDVINETHERTHDFFYLPIDSKVKTLFACEILHDSDS
jgi:hypothetical protein